MNEANGQSKLGVDSLDGHQFEDLIEELVKKMGFTVEKRKLTADGGIDLLAHSSEPLFEGKYVIQCKRYAQKIPEAPIRDLYGVVHSRNANKGILITNSTFTQAALDFAKDKQLELIDGAKLGSLLSKYDLFKFKSGVKLANRTAYLFYNFLPKIKKARQTFGDIKTGNMYIEKAMLNEKEWTNLLKRTLELSLGFYEWWGKTWASNFVQFLNEKPPNVQKGNETSEQLVQALHKFFKTYETFLQTTPPKRYKITKEKGLAYMEHLFKEVFQVANDLELLSELPGEQLKARIELTRGIRIDARFPKDLHDAVIAAYREAIGDSRCSNVSFKV